MILGWHLIAPGCGGTSTLSRAVTLPARWLREPQPISNQPMGVGSRTVRGGIDLGDLRSCPGVVGIVDAWTRRALAPRTPTNQSVRVAGFPHLSRRYRPGASPFCPEIVGIVDVPKELSSGDGTLSSPGATDPRRCRGATLVAR